MRTNYTGSSCTGPKGVLEDYNLYMQEQQQLQHQGSSSSTTNLLTRPLFQTDRQVRAQASQSFDSIHTLAGSPNSFMASPAPALIPGRQRGSSATTKPVQELDFKTFVSAVEGESPETLVLIHVYDPELAQCGLVDAFLNSLAPRYPDVKFHRLHTEEIEEVMYFDPVALPGILAYKNGDLIHCLLRITDEIPEWKQNGACSLAAFEHYLVQNDLL